MTRPRIGLAPILVPFVLVGLASGLGVWQVERLHWKERILAAIARAEASPPVPLGPDAADPGQFEKVVATGRLDPAYEAAYASDVRDVHGVPTFGVFLVEPLRRDGAPPLLVDLGWVPAGTDGHPSVTVAGPRSISGYVRRPEHAALFTPSPDLATRQFYALDPAVIGSGIGLGAVAPFTLVALRVPGAPPFPAATSSLPRPPNNHFQYALTWFALAGIAAGMSVAWWVQTIRATGRSPERETSV